jgi:lipid-A-disaccharide synthase-like uncharacterized protein
MGVFWGGRVVLQFFYYDPAMRRRFPVGNVVFGLAFGFLGGVFLMIFCMP